MTLRLRLFALLAALAVLLALGEWALVRKLSADLEGELTTAAAAVGRDVLRVLRFAGPPSGDRAEAGKRLLEHRVIVRRADGVAADGAEAETPAAAAPGASESTPLPAEPARPPPIGAWLTGDDVQLRVDENNPPRVLLLHGAVERRLEVPTSGVQDAVGRFGRRLLLASLAMVAAAVLLAGAVIHRFTRPLRDLAAAARRLGEGDLGLRAPAGPGEVGQAIAAFNQMSQRLAELDAEARRLRGSEQLSELGEVGRGLAHSLRNPLNALGLALDQLAERAADDESTEVAAAARRQIGRIDGALRGFLALAAGGATAGEIDLLAVARDVALEALQAQPASAPGAPAVAVEVRTPAEPLRLTGVEAEVRAALQALVVNAVEASPPGAAVVVTLDAADGAVMATVDDSGPGLAPEVRARLFTPHLTTKAAGAGVGLYLAHRLATDRYGGDLELTDRPKGGTRATLRLRDRRGTGVPRDAAAPASPEPAVGG
jgi:signal transduction histidine kinase